MKKILVFLVSCLLLTSCVSTPSFLIRTAYVDSVPSNMDLYVDDKYVGKTPINIEVGNILLDSTTIKFELKNEKQEIVFTGNSNEEDRQFIIVEKNKIVNQKYFNIYNSYSKDADKIYNGTISIGFNEEEVVMAWGNPDRIMETKSNYGISTTYVYRRGDYSSQYVNFNNGIVESMNNF